MTQRTLIIGGATGIGFAVAQLLAKRGDHIIVTAGSQAPGGMLAALDLSAAKQAFDTQFWGSLAVAHHVGLTGSGG